MAFGFTSLYIAGNVSDGVAPYTAVTGSVTPTAGNTVLVIAAIDSGTAAITGVTGSSVTGAASVATPSGWQVWAATGTGSAGAITVTFNASIGYSVAVVEVTGGGTSLLQTAVATGTGTTASATLSSAVTGATLAATTFVGTGGSGDAITPKSGWTELAEDNVDFGVSNQRLETQYKVAGETGASATWTGSRGWSMLALEVGASLSNTVGVLPVGF
jgi:hypothetical protein